ncbi:MAG: hypothetical protein DI626_10800 [Micavibrio aeruginosavorus]|uniref:Uncharacterized protein n=1 Tax=Micavibrio aeruginosavorus TaxID=349221 RepID=A0A2W4ZJP2_9BACT|nr:MAG: hypothetical protein DI626_10800 [Micavibrio aeruginosavorus]
MSETDKPSLGKAFGGKTKGSQIAYGHPYAETILDSALEIINQAETGRLLMRACQKGNIPIHVIKGTGETGFSPQARIVYMQMSAKKEKASPDDTLALIKAMREADQELIGLTAPDPMKDIMKYATVMHTKNLDAIVYTCKVVKELTNSSHFKELLDGLDKLGYGKVYKAYLKDASEEELFDAYADA